MKATSTFQTARDIDMAFRDMHTIRIPMGTPVKWIEGGGGGYVIDPSDVRLDSPTEGLFKHDSTYYFIFVDPKDVVEIPPAKPPAPEAPARTLNAKWHIDLDRTTPAHLVAESGVRIELWAISDVDLRRLGMRMVALMIQRADKQRDSRSRPPAEDHPLTIEDQAGDMLAAIDAIEGALMRVPDLLERLDMFKDADDDVVVKLPSVLGKELRDIRKALAECTRIVNSEQYNPPRV